MPRIEKSAPATFLTIQGLRGTAALMVVLYHSLGLWYEQLRGVPVSSFWDSGQSGVDVFFVISGFIVPLSIRRTAQPTSDSLKFLQRRIERIYPLYWMLTTLKVVLTLAAPALAVYGLGSGYHIFASYLLLPSFHPDGSVTPIVPPGWTLTFEMFFYLVIAMGIYLRASLRWFMPAILIPVALLTFLRMSPSIPVVRDQLPLVLEFLAGMVLAWRVQNGRVWAKTMPNVALAILALACLLLLPDTTAPRVVVWGIPAFVLVGASINLETAVGKRIPALLLLVGDASYSIYLSHWFVMPVVRHMEQMHRLAPIRSVASTVCLGMALGTAVGIGCYWLIERPVNRFFRVRRLTAVAATGVSV